MQISLQEDIDYWLQTPMVHCIEEKFKFEHKTLICLLHLFVSKPYFSVLWKKYVLFKEKNVCYLVFGSKHKGH